jgi:predicted esterase YcpF (UPF0227 family)
MQYTYLHGFASSPDSAKARYLSNRFTENHISLTLPDLNQGDFSHLTISRQVEQVATILTTPTTMIGSSLGGLTAAHLGQQYTQVEKLVLLAPAFGFLSHWLGKLDTDTIHNWQEKQYLPVYHYGEKREIPLSYDFVTDAQAYQENLLQRPLPTLILHGKDDEVIPIQASQEFASQRPWVQLIELDSNHALANVMAEIWQAVKLFCQIA